ncbi:ABC transporter ATP-binding protein [Streptomyces malaysiensis]|uniref:ABC transporter ATP-binding protein n=1 Tax=Streptomyces malaysiensis TaxID=92644 RepID=UPI00202EEDE0|nr:ATP-binding cassette domain-containing protein [Streptomyces malaysiensis]
MTLISRPATSPATHPPKDPPASMTEHSAAVRVDNLEIALPHGPVLLPATDLTLRAGQITALTGRSGSGKTTLLRALIGYLTPGARIVSGTVTVLGDEVFGLSPKALRQLRRHRAAYVGQDPGSALNPRMSASRLITELATDSSAEAVAALLEECRLPSELAHRRPGALSGGQQRRLALARALAREPDVLLLDEPTAGLDAALRDEIAALLSELATTRGVTILLACHDQRTVEACAEQVITLGSQAPGPSRRPSRPEKPKSPPEIAASSHDAHADGLRARGLNVSFTHRGHRHHALRQADFQALRGTSTGLVGPSGSGKTTLLRTLAGLQRPADGTLTWNGSPLPGHVRRRSADQQRRIQLVPQNPLGALNPAHTVGTALARPLRLHRTAAKQDVPDRVAALLEAVGLPADFARRHPHELSGGQRQRASIARALAAEPDLLLCDEITSALDPETTDAIMDLLTRLRAERGLTLVLVTHELDLVTAYADTVHRIEDGQVHPAVQMPAGGER